MEKIYHTRGKYDKWKIMADPEHAGKHPLHDNRFRATSDAKWDTDDPRFVPWKLDEGSIICELKDQYYQKGDALLISRAPELLHMLKRMVTNLNQHLDSEACKNNIEKKNLCPCCDEMKRAMKLIREIENK